jgi:hypothetical protein
MSEQLSFFYAYNPLEKSSYVFLKEDAESGHTMTIRPVWIIGDLEILHEWMDSSLRKSNWTLNPKNSSLFRYYKRTLLSENAQSFMVEQNRVPCFQFDILPAGEASWPKKMDLKANDYCLKFLFKESFRDPGLSIRGFSLIVDFVCSCSPVRTLYIQLLKPDYYVENQLEMLEFEKIQIFSLFGKSLPMFRRNISTLEY